MNPLVRKKYRDRYLNSNPWMQTMANIKLRCNNNKFWGYKYYGGKGIKCLINEKILKFLWFRDQAYDLKRPSIDRIDSKGNYTLENCRYIELSENIRRANVGKVKKKVV